MSSTGQGFPASLPCLPLSRHPIPHPSNPSFHLFSSKPSSRFPISATPPSSSSPSPIFPPLLKHHPSQLRVQEDEEATELKQTVEDNLNDPFVKFLESRSPAPDPTHHHKFTLQKNRRSSWRIAPNIHSLQHPDPDDPQPFELPDLLAPESEQTGSIDKLSADLSDGIVGEIVRIARDIPENMALGEFLGGYEGRLTGKDCIDVLFFMESEGLVMASLHFFEWMGLHEPSLVTPRACYVLFPFLGRAGMGDKLMVLFRELEKRKEFRDVHVYNAAISGLLCSQRYKDSWAVYESMERHNVLPDHVTCSAVITVMRKAGSSAKAAWEFFEKMNRKGVKWSQEVLGAIIKSFCDEGLKDEALIIQSEMEKEGVPSNAIVYNTLMDAYSKSNQIEEVEGLFSEMKAKGLEPNCETFNILMDAYSRRMQPEIVEKLLQELQDMGLEPNAKSYACLISAYGRQKNMSDMAANAFFRMKKVGIKPTSDSYTALIHAYSIRGWHEKAYIAFENMKTAGIKPSIEAYTALLGAFRRANDTQTLMRIWKMMISDKIEGTQVTFNILLDGFARQGQYIEARDVITEFGKIGLQPTLMAYNMLMNAYARGGQHSKLPQLLKEMAALGFKPDSITYSTMIYAYVRVHDFKRAFYYHKQMVKSGQVPDVRSYEKLRATLDVKAAKKNKEDRSAIVGIINSKPGMVKAKKRGKKDEFWKNKTKRFKSRDFSQVYNCRSIL